jgi:uncharacterized PurR-regulated membrane protein YhhQ (DUF165 family)
MNERKFHHDFFSGGKGLILTVGAILVWAFLMAAAAACWGQNLARAAVIVATFGLFAISWLMALRFKRRTGALSRHPSP